MEDQLQAKKQEIFRVHATNMNHILLSLKLTSSPLLVLRRGESGSGISALYFADESRAIKYFEVAHRRSITGTIEMKRSLICLLDTQQGQPETVMHADEPTILEKKWDSYEDMIEWYYREANQVENIIRNSNQAATGAIVDAYDHATYMTFLTNYYGYPTRR